MDSMTKAMEKKAEPLDGDGVIPAATYEPIDSIEDYLEQANQILGVEISLLQTETMFGWADVNCYKMMR